MSDFDALRNFEVAVVADGVQKIYLLRNGNHITLDISDQAFERFHFNPFKHSDIVTTPKGHGVVCGICDSGMLFFYLYGDNGVSYWGSVYDYSDALSMNIKHIE